MVAMTEAPERSLETGKKREFGKPFQKGVSGNPGGRPRASYDIATLARQYAPEALQALHDALNDPRLKVQAAQVLLDRGFGRPLQRQELSGPDGAPIQVQQVPDDRPTLDGFLVEFSEQPTDYVSAGQRESSAQDQRLNDDAVKPDRTLTGQRGE